MAMHPWLMGHRQDASTCLGETSGDPPSPAENKLVVDYVVPEFLSVETGKDWIQNKRMQHRGRQEDSWPLDNMFQLGSATLICHQTARVWT